MVLSQLSRYRTTLNDLAESSEQGAKELSERFALLGEALSSSAVSADRGNGEDGLAAQSAQTTARLVMLRQSR